MSDYDKITLKDGSYLYFKDWEAGNPWCLATAGR